MPKRGNCTCRYHRIVAACHSRVSIKRYHDASSVNFKTVAKGTRVSMLNNINTNIIHYFSQIPFFFVRKRFRLPVCVLVGGLWSWEAIL